MKQLCLDFDTPTPEEFPALVIRLVRQCRKLNEQIRKHNAALRRAKGHAEKIAGCSLEGWDEQTLMEYLRLFLRLQNSEDGSKIKL